MNTTIHIDGYDWVVQLNEYNELLFYFLEVVEETNEDDWWNGEYDFSPKTYTRRNVEDNVLPDGVSVVKVIRHILKSMIGIINRSQTDFFYFKPSTERKAKFYMNVFNRYIHLLEGEWNYQIINQKWFYFNKINE